eukprot:CAMPEP_0170250758 /NCGR_PEP_ID=MMETSP0116_2-20130129/25199_1 /TAXON_ID=400756 /ORGANISM="Durinskia baltica, Strain CSIRO CS-38" /LENGTH=456 /DNA_ID=CAMNT_0010501701 /DNA_START=62 /DNA_END=1432 /DNA_ORIENTATION=+
MEQSEDTQVLGRLRELLTAQPDLGYRAAHSALQKDDAWKSVGLKRLQRLLPIARDSSLSIAKHASCAATTGHQVEDPALATVEDRPAVQKRYRELRLERPDASVKYGMMIAKCQSPPDGYGVTDICEGGVVDAWNREHPEEAIRVGDILVSVNWRNSFDDMMCEFRDQNVCVVRIRAADNPSMVNDFSGAEKETAAWQARRARVTAALIPGLKKIIESEFGPGAGERIGRVEEMYLRAGRNQVYEEIGPLGKIFAPGYIEGLSPVRPFHDTKLYPWIAELRCQWKAIRKELRACMHDESLWTPGAYAASNDAYGKDWRIMGVLREDRWQDEERFRVTTAAIKKLPNCRPSEAFFARMPPRTKIADHSDNLNYILTSHLGLELEEGLCSMTNGCEETYWKEGEMFVADTSFIHSTKNESLRPRYVLVVRFWHPGLTVEEQRAIHLSHTILTAAGQPK